MDEDRPCAVAVPCASEDERCSDLVEQALRVSKRWSLIPSCRKAPAQRCLDLSPGTPMRFEIMSSSLSDGTPPLTQLCHDPSVNMLITEELLILPWTDELLSFLLADVFPTKWRSFT